MVYGEDAGLRPHPPGRSPSCAVHALHWQEASRPRLAPKEPRSQAGRLVQARYGSAPKRAVTINLYFLQPWMVLG